MQPSPGAELSEVVNCLKIWCGKKDWCKDLPVHVDDADSVMKLKPVGDKFEVMNHSVEAVPDRPNARLATEKVQIPTQHKFGATGILPCDEVAIMMRDSKRK